jgi:hypothetical protein
MLSTPGHSGGVRDAGAERWARVTPGLLSLLPVVAVAVPWRPCLSVHASAKASSSGVISSRVLVFQSSPSAPY